MNDDLRDRLAELEDAADPEHGPTGDGRASVGDKTRQAVADALADLPADATAEDRREQVRGALAARYALDGTDTDR
mgnify:FL=1